MLKLFDVKCVSIHQKFACAKSINIVHLTELDTVQTMSYCNQSLLLPQCSATSSGPVNSLIASVVQTLLAFHCSISPECKWPSDHGPRLLRNRKKFYLYLFFHTENCFF